MLEPLLIVELCLLGACGGFLAGLLGIGGGMVLVPFLTAIVSARGIGADVAVKMAIATGMATIVFTSMSSVRAHHRRGAVRWDLVRRLAPGIVLGGLAAGAGLFSVLRGRPLALFFAVFVGYSALRMLAGAARPPVATRPMPGPGAQVAAGAGIGLVAGLLGAGGGFISVPWMTRRGVDMRNAVATSAALGFPIASVNVAGYVWAGASVAGRPPYSLGYVWLPALAVIASCSVLTAPWGARMAHSWPVPRLKRIFACLLFALAAYMLWKALAG